MPVSISSIAGLAPVSGIPQSAGAKSAGGFQSALDEAIRAVGSANETASQSVERFLTGEGEEVHTTALAVERAELTFDLFLQTRNKVVNAYQEIMRMQL